MPKLTISHNTIAWLDPSAFGMLPTIIVTSGRASLTTTLGIDVAGARGFRPSKEGKRQHGMVLNPCARPLVQGSTTVIPEIASFQ
jgi:hypothetical protein